MNKEHYLKYLPSKKFTTIFIIVLIFLTGTLIFGYFKKVATKKAENQNNTALKIENQTFNEFVQNDSDKDGIADWEETLWGTDKNKKETFAGTPDATYIENKKNELEIEQGATVKENKLTETDKFAREFFSSFVAMKASGQVDSDTINGFSNALGQKIVNPSLIDVYTEKDLKINSENDLEKKIEYYENVKKLFESYQKLGIGNELDIVNNGLASSTTNTPNSYQKLNTISGAYKNFAKKIIATNVPSDLATYNLNIANSANNTGIAVESMAQIIKDPLIGLQGLSQYQKYSEDLVQAVTDLQTALTGE